MPSSGLKYLVKVFLCLVPNSFSTDFRGHPGQHIHVHPGEQEVMYMIVRAVYERETGDINETNPKPNFMKCERFDSS